jgi:hypothetical protein
MPLEAPTRRRPGPARRRSDDHVGQAVHLLAEGALRVRHARHAAVQAVEHHGAEDADAPRCSKRPFIAITTA